MAKNPNSGAAPPPESTPGIDGAQPPGPDGQAVAPTVTAAAAGGSGGPAVPTGPTGSATPVTSAAPATPATSTAPASPSRADQAGNRAVRGRMKQFVVAPRQQAAGMQMMGAAFAPLSLSILEQAMRDSPDIELVDKVSPKSMLGALADGIGGSEHGVLVARMTEQKASVLHQQGQGRLLVERDQPLNLMDPALRQPAMVTGVMPTVAGAGQVLNALISVIGRDGAPLPDAEVALFGSMLPATGVSDANGLCTLSLIGETAQSVRGLYVKPKADYWSFYQRDPDISSDQTNVVQLQALSDWPALTGFPRQRAWGWGQKAMRLDLLPASYRGQGVRIAIIDSGVANSHDNLQGVKAGFDVLNKKTDPGGWNVDTLGHGTHCAGMIAAAEIASGLRGFAPQAEVHVCKLFPGGQVSQLIDALEYCIDQQIDVVNLSLGGADMSEALEQQIVRAKRAGIACIVAAGNSAGAVQYPASSPNVLAVAAVGKLGEFPDDSYHAETLSANVDAYGYFTAKFSCFGAQVGVCAPGVAIVSCVPPNNFAAWDGTSMAAPHITGLAALVLAHHPDFQSQYKARGPERVERLFQLIRASARRVSLADPSHIGFGMPDAPAAVGLQLPAAVQAQAQAQAAMRSKPPASSQAAGPQLGGMGNITGIGGPAGGLGNMAGIGPQQLDPFGADAARMAYNTGIVPPWLAHYALTGLPLPPYGSFGSPGGPGSFSDYDNFGGRRW